MSIQSYRDLKVWQKGMDLAVSAYALTRRFPDAERYGLTSQLQRSAVSIPANTAEGHAIGLKKPFRRHLRIARGSVAESETHVLVAERLGYLTNEHAAPFLSQCDEVSRMLSGLINSINRRS